MSDQLSNSERTSLEEAVAEAELATGAEFWVVTGLATSGRPALEAGSIFDKLRLADPAVLLVVGDDLRFVHAVGTRSVSDPVGRTLLVPGRGIAETAIDAIERLRVAIASSRPPTIDLTKTENAF